MTTLKNIVVTRQMNDLHCRRKKKQKISLRRYKITRFGFHSHAILIIYSKWIYSCNTNMGVTKITQYIFKLEL